MWWSYTRYVLKLDSSNALMPATDANVNWPLATTLARPYPQLVSGTPQSWSFDPSGKTFSFKYSTARAAGGGNFADGAETDIEVPALAFPNGYNVSVQGATVSSAANSSLLAVVTCPGVTSVSVTVTEGPAAPSSCNSAAPVSNLHATATGVSLPSTAGPRGVATPVAVAALAAGLALMVGVRRGRRGRRRA
jgi:hypothetical protein